MRFSLPFLKSFSSVLALLVFLTNGVLAYAPEVNFWAKRIEKNNLLDPLLQALSHQYGTVRKINTSTKNSSKVVIHIQDVHLNPEAQTNIGAAIQKLIDHKLVDLVALEGAFDPIDLTPYRTFPHQGTVQKVADYLLKENKISGPVHAGFVSTAAIPPFVGVDDSVHYQKNVGAYKKSTALIKTYKADWEKERKGIEKEKGRVFGDALLEFDQKVQAYRDEKMDMGDYLLFLNDKSDDASLTLQTFLEALKIERKLDFQKVEQERTRLIEKLLGTLSSTETETLISMSVAFRLGNQTHSKFYRFLNHLCKENGIRLRQFSALDDYIRYVLLSDGIDEEKLFEELTQLENRLYSKLAQSQKEKQLIKKSRTHYLAGKLINFSLTPQEWKEYKETPPNLPIHDMGRNNSSPRFLWGGKEGYRLGIPFENFYHQAELRDKAMAENLSKVMKKHEAKTAILVTGGFHSKGIQEALGSEQTIISFTPKISKVETKNGSAYLSVFTQQKTPLEKLFEGQKLFLATAPKSKDVLGLFPHLATTLRTHWSKLHQGAKVWFTTHFHPNHKAKNKMELSQTKDLKITWGQLQVADRPIAQEAWAFFENLSHHHPLFWLYQAWPLFTFGWYAAVKEVSLTKSFSKMTEVHPNMNLLGKAGLPLLRLTWSLPSKQFQVLTNIIIHGLWNSIFVALLTITHHISWISNHSSFEKLEIILKNTLWMAEKDLKHMDGRSKEARKKKKEEKKLMDERLYNPEKHKDYWTEQYILSGGNTKRLAQYLGLGFYKTRIDELVKKLEIKGNGAVEILARKKARVFDSSDKEKRNFVEDFVNAWGNISILQKKWEMSDRDVTHIIEWLRIRDTPKIGQRISTKAKDDFVLFGGNTKTLAAHFNAPEEIIKAAIEAIEIKRNLQLKKPFMRRLELAIEYIFAGGKPHVMKANLGRRKMKPLNDELKKYGIKKDPEIKELAEKAAKMSEEEAERLIDEWISTLEKRVDFPLNTEEEDKRKEIVENRKKRAQEMYKTSDDNKKKELMELLKIVAGHVNPASLEPPPVVFGPLEKVLTWKLLYRGRTHFFGRDKSIWVEAVEKKRKEGENNKKINIYLKLINKIFEEPDTDPDLSHPGNVSSLLLLAFPFMNVSFKYGALNIFTLGVAHPDIWFPIVTLLTVGTPRLFWNDLLGIFARWQMSLHKVTSITADKTVEPIAEKIIEIAKIYITGKKVGRSLNLLLNDVVNELGIDQKTLRKKANRLPSLTLEQQKDLEQWLKIKIENEIEVGTLSFSKGMQIAQLVSSWIGQDIELKTFEHVVAVVRADEIEQWKEMFSSDFSAQTKIFTFIVDEKEAVAFKNLKQYGVDEIYVVKNLFRKDGWTMRSKVFGPKLKLALHKQRQKIKLKGKFQNKPLLVYSNQLTLDHHDLGISDTVLNRLQFKTLEQLKAEIKAKLKNLAPTIRAMPYSMILKLGRLISRNA